MNEKDITNQQSSKTSKKYKRNLKLNKKLNDAGIVRISTKKYVCVKCENVFQKTRKAMDYSQTCPNCMTGQSFGEEKAIYLLKKHGIKFKKEKTFPDLKGIKGNSLRFDFLIHGDRRDFLLEIDDEQHMKRTRWGPNTIQHDKIKSEYCKSKKIKLYRVIYKFGYLNLLEQDLMRILESEFDSLSQKEAATQDTLSESELAKIRLNHQSKRTERLRKNPHRIIQSSFVEIKANESWIMKNKISIELRGQAVQVNPSFIILELLNKQKIKIPYKEIVSCTTLKTWGGK
jgi:hypothetical protein